MNIGVSLTNAALRWPDKVGIVFEEQRWTFSEFNRLANRIANAFEVAGVGEGDRVTFVMANAPEQLAAFYGLLKLGAIPVPVNFRLAANEIKYIINNSRSRVVVCDERTQETIIGMRDELGEIRTILHVRGVSGEGAISLKDFIAPASDREPQVHGGGEAPAFIMYTSGTTGAPKGVVRSHRAELIGALYQALESGLSHDDVTIHNLPLFHIAQLQLQVMPLIMLGARGIITPTFDVEKSLRLVEKERVTCQHSVPTQMVMMQNADRSKYDLSSLRKGSFGGQTLNQQTTTEFMQMYPDSFLHTYGSTEALAVFGCNYRKRPDKIGTVGHPFPNVEPRIVHPGSRNPEEVVAHGEAGELIFRSPTLFNEYFDMPEKTATTVIDGWYYTGDSAYLDPDGFTIVLGRMDHTIKSGAENIHPSEVESVLFKHKKVANAAVVGLPSRKWGQVVCAAIVRKDPGLSAEEIDRFCLDNADLANFKRPKHYFFVEDIPSNATGKVERTKLRDLLLERLDTEL